MSVRDIIEKWHLISTNYARHGYTAAVHGRDFEEMRDDFASALEELALMEAVCEAADTFVATDTDADAREWLARLETTTTTLQACRKERGL